MRKVEPEGEEPNQVDHHVVPLREGVLNQRSAVLRREAERIFMVSQHLDQLHLRPEVEQMEQQTAEDDPSQRKHVFRCPLHTLFLHGNGITLRTARLVVVHGQHQRINEVDQDTGDQHQRSDQRIPVGTQECADRVVRLGREDRHDVHRHVEEDKEHEETTGNAHFYAQSEQECFEQVKRLVSFIPWNNQERAKVVESKEPTAVMNIEDVVPADPKQPYDVRNVIKCIVDDSDFLEVQELWAANIVIGFGRMGGETVGFVANQPMVLAGVLDCDSADKAARFIRFCDSFNIPIITLEDMPGYLPGVDQEHAGVIRHGAKVLYAYSEATVPKITVILRKAYGGGYIAMNSRHLGADFMFAWPSAEIAVMGPEGAANIIFRKEIMEAEDQNAMRQEKVKEYIEKFANPYVAASKGFIDSVIEPKETRSLLLHALKLSVLKEEYRPAKKHGLPPF